MPVDAALAVRRHHMFTMKAHERRNAARKRTRTEQSTPFQRGQTVGERARPACGGTVASGSLNATGCSKYESDKCSGKVTAVSEGPTDRKPHEEKVTAKIARPGVPCPPETQNETSEQPGEG